MRLTASFLTLFSCLNLAMAADSPAPEAEVDPRQAAYEEHVKAITGSLHYTEGAVPLPGASVTLNLPEGYRYISPADAKKVLEDLWGNPPEAVNATLGMIIPKGEDLTDVDSWAIVATYDNDGYVSDKDADEINYDELLKTLQSGEVEENKAREAQGYSSLNLVGWAMPPHYDKAHHVLYWAKHLVSGRGGDSLNYDMRVLGRRGTLSLNAVASMERLPDVESHTPEIISMAKFNDGHLYSDFNPTTDKVSSVGLAGLVLGGAVAAKSGLLKGIFVALMAAKKAVIAGLVGLIAVVRRFFGGKKEQA